MNPIDPNDFFDVSTQEEELAAIINAPARPNAPIRPNARIRVADNTVVNPMRFGRLEEDYAIANADIEALNRQAENLRQLDMEIEAMGPDLEDRLEIELRRVIPQPPPPLPQPAVVVPQVANPVQYGLVQVTDNTPLQNPFPVNMVALETPPNPNMFVNGEIVLRQALIFKAFNPTTNRTDDRLTFTELSLGTAWVNIFNGLRNLQNPFAVTGRYPRISAFNTTAAELVLNTYQRPLFATQRQPARMNEINMVFKPDTNSTQVLQNTTNPFVGSFNFGGIPGQGPRFPAFTEQTHGDFWPRYRSMMHLVYKACMRLTQGNEGISIATPLLFWEISIEGGVSHNYVEHLGTICWNLLEEVRRLNGVVDQAGWGLRFDLSFQRTHVRPNHDDNRHDLWSSRILGFQAQRQHAIDHLPENVPAFGNDFFIPGTPLQYNQTQSRIKYGPAKRVTFITSRTRFMDHIRELIHRIIEYHIQRYNFDETAGDEAWLNSQLQHITVDALQFNFTNNLPHLINVFEEVPIPTELTISKVSLQPLIDVLARPFFMDDYTWPGWIKGSIMKLYRGSFRNDTTIYKECFDKNTRKTQGLCIKRFLIQFTLYTTTIRHPELVYNHVAEYFKQIDLGTLSMRDLLTDLAKKADFNILVIDNNWYSYKYYTIPVRLNKKTPVVIVVPPYTGCKHAHIGMSTHEQISEIKHKMGEVVFLTNVIPKLTVNNSKSGVSTYRFESLWHHKDYSIQRIHCYLDIETFTTGKREAYCVCAYLVCGKETHQFSTYGLNCINEFFETLYAWIPIHLPVQESDTTPKRYFTHPISIWAYNGAKFDFIYFLKCKHIRQFEISGSTHDIKHMRWIYKHEDSELDTTTEFTTYDFALTMGNGLKNLANLFKVKPKMDNQIVLNINQTNYEENEVKVIEYCMNDCIVLHDIIQEFKKTINNIYITPTLKIGCPDVWISAASLADKIYRGVFLYKDEYGQPFTKEELKTRTVWGLPRNAYDMVNSNYTGGFTMAFATQMAGGYLYDINSSYPFEMTKPLPHRLVNKSEKFFTPALTWSHTPPNKHRLWVVNSYEFPEGTFCPCIPTKTKSGNIYVLKGEYTLVWDTTVFWSMDALYCKYSFAGYIEFESDTIYKRWVDCFYAKKSQSAGVERELYKLFLNSLYGKTGQKEYQASTYFRDFNDVTKYITDGSKRKDISVLESIKVHNNSPITVSQNGVQMQALPDLNEGCYEVRMTNTDITPNHVGSLVFIASYITAGARLHLFKTIHYIKQRGGEVYYCDTDSIFTNIELPSDMVSETEIGLWKLEKKISKGKFWGSKCYMYYDESGKTTKKVKGVPKIFIPPDEELWNLDEGGISAHISTSWNRHWGYVENKESLKVIRSTLNRRIYSNNTSKPFKSVNEFLLF